MKLTPNINIKIRAAQKSDDMLLLKWANDTIVRKNSFNSNPVILSEHHAWLSSRLNNKSHCKIFICETLDGVPIGQTRFDKKNFAWEIDYSIDKAFRGNKLSARMLKMSLDKVEEEYPGSCFFGYVKNENAPSLNTFKNLGFTLELKGNFFICRFS